MSPVLMHLGAYAVVLEPGRPPFVVRRSEWRAMPTPDLGSVQVDGDGIWRWVYAGRTSPSGGALFLDRDGVLVEEVGYLHRVSDLRLIAGSAAALARVNRSAVPVILVSNQAGIGRGFYGWREFAHVTEAMCEMLSRIGASVDAIYACPFHADAATPMYQHPDHPARKPNPGMILKAARDLHLDLPSSWLVGDRTSDIVAARRAGLEGAVHILSGHGREERDIVERRVSSDFRLAFAADLADALSLIPLLGHRTPA